MKIPQHPHKQLGYGILCRFEMWTDDLWSLCSSGALGSLGWYLVTDVSIQLIDPWRLYGYVFPKHRYPSTKLRLIKFKRAKVATTVRTELEISQGLRMFENRFIGGLVGGELCCCFHQSLMGRDSSVGIATRYGLYGFGVRTLVGRHFPHPSRPAWGSPIFPFHGHGGSFPWLWPPTHLTSAEVKEKVQPYSFSVPSWHFIERTSPFSKIWVVGLLTHSISVKIGKWEQWNTRPILEFFDFSLTCPFLTFDTDCTFSNLVFSTKLPSVLSCAWVCEILMELLLWMFCRPYQKECRNGHRLGGDFELFACAVMSH